MAKIAPIDSDRLAKRIVAHHSFPGASHAAIERVLAKGECTQHHLLLAEDVADLADALEALRLDAVVQLLTTVPCRSNGAVTHQRVLPSVDLEDVHAMLTRHALLVAGGAIGE